MHLVKIEDGLLEKDDFLLTSEFGDFLGDGVYNRSLTSFNLESGTIERALGDWNEFLIEVEKEATELGAEDKFEFYLSDGSKRAGLEEVFNTTYAKCWRLALKDGYIQGYKSEDGLTWENVGGTRFANKPLYQGFKATGKTLAMNSYKVYRSPYLKIQNFYPGTVAKLLKPDGSFVKERLFNNNHECEMYLENLGEYKLEFYDSVEGALLYSSEVLDLKPGDVFMFTEFNLQMFYKGIQIRHETTFLETLVEKVTLKNASSEIYNDINISVSNPNTDNISISLDGAIYSGSLAIPTIGPTESIDIFIKIVKDKTKLFKVSEFSLDIS